MQNHKENVCKGCFCNTPPQYYFLVLYLTAVPVIEEFQCLVEVSVDQTH